MTAVCESSEPVVKIELHPREAQILPLVVANYTNVKIAHTLHLSENTIKTYLKRLYTKLDADGRVDLVVKAIRLGLVEI